MNQEKLFHYWLNSTTEFVFFKNLAGEYIAASSAAVSLIGLNSLDDLIGKNDFQIFPRENAQLFRINDRQAIETGKSVSDTNWIQHPRFGKILIETVVAPMKDNEGNIIGVQGTSRDITEKHLLQENAKEQQYKMNALLDNIPAAIWIKDTKNNYVAVNKEYENFYKIKKNDILGHNVNTILEAEKLFSDEDLQTLARQDYSVLNSKSSQTVSMFTKRERRLVKIIKAPILNKEGTCLGLVGISIAE